MLISLQRSNQPTSFTEIGDEPIEAKQLLPVYLGEMVEAQLMLKDNVDSIKVELQTSVSRTVLYEGVTSGVTLTWDIKDMGMHLIAVRGPRGRTAFLRYAVSKPLSLKTKLTELSCGWLLVEAEVANEAASDDLILEKFSLGVEGRAIGNEAWLEKGSAYEQVALPKGITKQLVFRLDSSSLSDRLDLRWRCQDRHGQLQTMPLRFTAEGSLSLHYHQQGNMIQLSLRNNEQLMLHAISLQYQPIIMNDTVHLDRVAWQVGELAEGEEVHQQISFRPLKSSLLTTLGPWWLSYELGGVVHRIPHELYIYTQI